jgi:esterase/lipase superfamily enzyme
MGWLRKNLGFWVAVVVLAACTPRGAVLVFDAPDSANYVAPIFVATTRAPSESPYDFNEERSSKVSLARYDIAVPSSHEQGQIEWPKGTPNSDTDMLTVGVKNFSSRASFIASANTFRQSGQESVVFIHGYNNTFAEGLYRFAQMAHDIDIQGPKFHFSWSSAGDARGYIYDRDSVLFARDGLEQLLTDVAKTSTDGVFLVAHSIGSALLIETLRQMSIGGNASLQNKLRGVILISPDIDVNVFSENLKRIKPMPDPMLIFVSKKDLALRFSSFLTGNNKRLGVIDNLDSLKGNKIEIVDVSAFKDGDGLLNHSVALTSPTVLNLLKNRDIMSSILDPNAAAIKGTNIVSRVIQTANDVTQIILNPRVTQ